MKALANQLAGVTLGLGQPSARRSGELAENVAEFVGNLFVDGLLIDGTQRIAHLILLCFVARFPGCGPRAAILILRFFINRSQDVRTPRPRK